MHKIIRAKHAYSMHVLRYQQDCLSRKGPTGHHRGDHPPVRCLNPHGIADVAENFRMSHGHQTQLTKIRVGRKIF